MDVVIKKKKHKKLGYPLFSGYSMNIPKTVEKVHREIKEKKRMRGAKEKRMREKRERKRRQKSEKIRQV